MLSTGQIWNMLAAFGILDDSGGMRRAWENSATLGLGQYNSKLHQPCRSVCVGTSSLKNKSYLSRTQKNAAIYSLFTRSTKIFPLNYWLIKRFWSRHKRLSNDIWTNNRSQEQLLRCGSHSTVVATQFDSCCSCAESYSVQWPNFMLRTSCSKHFVLAMLHLCNIIL